MWYINGRVESLPLTDTRYINGRVESIVLRRKARDFSVMRTGKWRKQVFILLRTDFLKICQTRISKEIRQEADRIIIVLKIQVPGYTGWYRCPAVLINTGGLWRKRKKPGNHLMLTSEHTAREIERKAKKVMGMLKRGIKFTPTQPDVMAILEKLKGWIGTELSEQKRQSVFENIKYVSGFVSGGFCILTVNERRIVFSVHSYNRKNRKPSAIRSFARF